VAGAQLLLNTLREDVARKPLDLDEVAAAAGVAGHNTLSKVRRTSQSVINM